MNTLLNYYHKTPYNKHILISIAIFIITIVFKSLLSTDYGLWYDESFSVFYSQGTINAINIVSKWDVNPPFYNYLLHFWTNIFGISEFSVRFLSLFFIAVATALVYLFSIRFFNQDTAVFSSSLFFSSDVLFYYSQEARTYSLLFLLYIISTWIFFELLNKPNIYLAILLGVLNWMIIFSHYLEGVIVLFQGIIILIYFNKKSFIFFLISCLTSLLCLNKWIFRMSDIFLSGGNKIVPIPKISIIKVVFLSQFNSSAILIIVFAIIIVLGSIYLIININSENKITTKYILYFIMIAFLSHFIFYLLSFKAPMYGVRYLLFTVPCFYIVIAFMLSSIKISLWLKYSLMCAIFCISMSTIKYDINKHMDYKNAVPVIKSNKDNETLVILQSISLDNLFAYYYDKEVFRANHNLLRDLNKNNIFTINDTTGINKIPFHNFKKVIFVQTFSQFADPHSTLKSFFENNFEHIDEINDYEGIKINIYNIVDFNTDDSSVNELKSLER